MYYKIKIKSNGSEFSLESNNKEVTQREMDIYFASIFDVSDEFKSKIKKIEITNKNVKSIDEIENPKTVKEEPILKQISDEEIERLAKLKAQEIIEKARLASLEKMQTVEPAPLPTEIQETKLQNIEVAPTTVQITEIKEQEPVQIISTVDEIPTPIQTTPTEIKEVQTQEITTVVKFQNEPIQISQPTAVPIPTPSAIPTVSFISEQTQINQETVQINNPEIQVKTEIINSIPKDEFIPSSPTEIIKEIEQNEIEFQIQDTQNTQEKDEIEELILLAQQKINQLEEQSKEAKNIEEEQEEIINVSIENKKPFDKEEVTKTFQEQNEEYAQNNQAKLANIFANTPAEKETIDEGINTVDTPQANNDCDILENPPEISLAEVELSLNENKQPQVQEENYEISSYESDLKTQIEPPKEEKPKPTIPPFVNQIDFKPFLSSFACNEIVDEFIVCAYFIKNVINQTSFTIKFINSKLFQATGKIADMSVIDELVTKEYIKVIETDDGKKYCITANGESYFAEKFQN